MSLSWLHQWVRRFFPAHRRPVRRPRFVRPALSPLEDRLLLSVSLNLEVSSSSSYGVTNSAVIQYTNTGTTDAPAPVLILSADNANLWLPTDPQASGPSLQVLATNPDPNGPAGTLAPGASGSIVVDFTSTDSTSGNQINFGLGQLTSGQTIDWSSLESSMRPSYINPTAWNAVFANFTADVGSTTDSYQAALDADATYLAQFGEPTNDVAGLVAYEITKADNEIGTSSLGGSFDVSVPTPGPALTFARSFQPTISGRDQAGLFGLGWTSNWDISAGTDSQGNVTIDEDGGNRYFAKQSAASYLPTLGDSGTLTALSGGGYQLTEMDGSLTTFNAKGTLSFVQDSNGNRITAGYNSSGQLASLTESDGDKLTLAYNSQGFIGQITDPSGETAKYTYDTAGHLLKVLTSQGTTQYSYVTGTGTPGDNALQTILNPDSTQLNYTYDSEGRLTGSFHGTAANPIEPVTLSYLSPGGVTYTDAKGNKTTVLYTDLGQAAVITDPLGNATKLSYDASGDLTSAVLPGGATYSYTYDLQGDLLSETDGLGNTTNFAYDAKGNLASYTDAKGNTTSYAYSGNDNLLSVTYANGDKQSYSYNPLGEAKQFINARGQAISYQYNTQGQIGEEKFADGTSYSYIYDTHGNLIQATDAQNRVTKFIYGGDPNNPNNPDLLTEVEYPDGTYLKFSYYAGGQRKQSVDQTGFTVNYTYDAANNLTGLTDSKGNPIVKYTYDAAGNLIQQDNGSGTRTLYTYDAAGNVSSITNLAPNHTTVNSFDNYTYDALGNVLTDTNQDGQWVYTYDADSQLIQSVFAPNSSDPDGLTAQNIQYAYDAAGNRTTETVNGVTTTYFVNNVNEYTSSTTAGVTTTYQYDLDGNLSAQTTGGSTTKYAFNDLSQLTGINGPGLTASYFYDPLGNRVSQTVNGATTNFQIDPALGDVAAFSGTGAYNNSGGLLAHYTYGLGLVSQVSASGAAGYYDFDLTGNTIGITNASGSYVNKYSYLPFGQTTALAAALPNPFTLVGRFGVIQDTSNLFAMGAREFASGTGQFLSNDPLGLAGGDSNVRRYVANNPVNLIDPEGTQAYSNSAYSGGKSSELDGTTVTRYSNGRTYYSNQYTHGWMEPGTPSIRIQVGTNPDGTPKLDQLDSDPHPNTPPTATYGGYGTPKVRNFGSPGDGYVYQPNTSINLNSQKQISDPQVSGKLTPNLPTNSQPSGTATNYIPEPAVNLNAIPPMLPPAVENQPSQLWVENATFNSPISSITSSSITDLDDTAAFVDFNPTIYQAFYLGEQSHSAFTQYFYNIIANFTPPEEGAYGVQTLTITTTDGVPHTSTNNPFSAPNVYQAKLVDNHVSIQTPAGTGNTRYKIASFTDPGPNEGKGIYTANITLGPFVTSQPDIEPDSGNTYDVYANMNFRAHAPESLTVTLTITENQMYGIGVLTAGTMPAYDNVTTPITLTNGPSSSTSVQGQLLNTPGGSSTSSPQPQIMQTGNGDPPLAIIDTTDPTITSASQVSVSVGTPSDASEPIPLVTGITLTQLPGGVTQIVVDGVVSAVQPGAGLVAAAPLNITLGNEPTLTVQVEVDETLSDYAVNPVVVNAVAGQKLQNVQVATLEGPANGSYSATINWGDGDTSTGVITALGGGLYNISGSKPHPYATTGTDTITVTVNGPGAIPAPAAQTTATVMTASVSPPPSPPPSPPSSPPPSLPSSPPSPAPPPSPPSHPQPPSPHPATPEMPSLLAFLNGLLQEVETLNSNGTTITDSLFGLPLVVETYDYFGKLESATLLGFNITPFASL